MVANGVRMFSSSYNGHVTHIRSPFRHTYGLLLHRRLVLFIAHDSPHPDWSPSNVLELINVKLFLLGKEHSDVL